MFSVAKSYATTGNYETPEDYASHYLAESNHDPKVSIKLLKKEAEHFDKSGWEKADITKDMIPKIEEALKKGDTRSNLYKVDIPDEHIPNMLDWDKPLSEQPKHIQDVAWKYKNALITKTKMTGDKSIWDLNGADLYGVMQRYNPSEKGKLLKENVDFADVSSKLNELGVPGIRYLDQGSRDTGGTSNFVVFDPSSVKILEKNGQPTRKDIIEQQVNKVIE